ncbi:MAG: hypothetical protein FJW96_05980, partial [Actinobacteria bacterium]|nr:hypothetical protein [Actinomycetota bacterium]
MKRPLMEHARLKLAATLILVIAVAAIGTAAAEAAAPKAWSGVVVGKDTQRQSVVVALGSGAVRTVRTSVPLRRVPVGARIRTSASALADGTFRGTSLEVTGRARRGLVKGVVVHVDQRHRQLAVSAGGSVLTLRHGLALVAGKKRTTQSSSSLAAGDIVLIDVQLDNGVAQTASVKTLGQASAVVLEGIFTGSA